MSFGGNKNAAYNKGLKDFMKDVPDSKFVSYVDGRGDLANAWRNLEMYQAGQDVSGNAGILMKNGMTPAQQAEYWIKKGVGSKAAFGRYHAGEDDALLKGTYPGGTQIKPGTDAYNKYFPNGETYYDTTTKNDDDDDGDSTGGGASNVATTGPASWIAQKDYAAPKAKDWSRYMPNRSGFGPNQLFGPIPNFLSSRVFTDEALASRKTGKSAGTFGSEGASSPGSMVRPGFIPGSSDDPALGGSGTYTPPPKTRSIGLMMYQPWSAEYKKRFLPKGLMNYTPKPLGQWSYSPTDWVNWADYKDLPTEDFEEEEEPKNNNGDPPGGDDP